jgi:hypothetical protein
MATPPSWRPTDGHTPLQETDGWPHPLTGDRRMATPPYRRPTVLTQSAQTLVCVRRPSGQQTGSTPHAKAVCVIDNLPQELNSLQETFTNNGCGERQTFRALNPPTRAPPPCRQDHTAAAFLPCLTATSNRTGRALSKHKEALQSCSTGEGQPDSFFYILKNEGVFLNVPYTASCDVTAGVPAACRRLQTEKENKAECRKSAITHRSQLQRSTQFALQRKQLATPLPISSASHDVTSCGI